MRDGEPQNKHGTQLMRRPKRQRHGIHQGDNAEYALPQHSRHQQGARHQNRLWRFRAGEPETMPNQRKTIFSLRAAAREILAGRFKNAPFALI